MTLDRTKPPPFTEPYGYGDGRVAFDFGTDTTGWGQESTPYTIDEAWAVYDRITLPARVALLRELAAEFNGNAGELRCEARWHEGSEHGAECKWMAEERKGWADVFKERADELEASGRTEGP
jgi:hypothetical protein